MSDAEPSKNATLLPGKVTEGRRSTSHLSVSKGLLNDLPPWLEPPRAHRVLIFSVLECFQMSTALQQKD